MEKFLLSHWDAVKQSNDENIDPYSLVQKCVTVHSEHNADFKIVRDFFKNCTGTFLCCGANNGKDHSFQLLEQGWTGVYIEPDPYACVELIKETTEYKDQVTILNVALFPEPGFKQFNISTTNSFLSSGKQGWIEHHGIDSSNVRSVIVNAVTLTNVMEMLNFEVDYIQTDLEGFDIDIVNSFDWSLAKSCKMICTEAGPAVLKQLCQQGDFMITDITNTNSFYKRKEFVL